jgi:hypothetical protein
MWELILGGGVAVALIEVAERIILRIADKRGSRRGKVEFQIEALEKGQRALLRERIRCLCRLHIAVGEIGFSDRDDLISMHEAYHSLGGNGNLDVEMENITKLRSV